MKISFITSVIILSSISLSSSLADPESNLGDKRKITFEEVNRRLMPKGNYNIMTTMDDLSVNAVELTVKKHYHVSGKLSVDFIRFVKLPHAIVDFCAKDELLLSYSVTGFYTETGDVSAKCLVWYNPVTGKCFVYDAPVSNPAEDDWVRLYDQEANQSKKNK